MATLTQQSYAGERLLHKLNPKLQMSHAVSVSARKAGGLQRPDEKINAYIERIKRIYDRRPELIEKMLYNKVIIKQEEVPQSYFENQKRKARNDGHGNIEITNELREQEYNTISNNQKTSLKSWIDYFACSDSDTYPLWAKYFAFNGMLKLSSYDKETKTFGKRDKGTVAPFTELNQEALGFVVDVMTKKTSGEELPYPDDMDLREAAASSNFGKLYSWAINKFMPISKEQLANINGKWVKYNQGNDYEPLFNSLQGHGTGWCTASGEETAKKQLEAGDFHVFYSCDKDGNATVPRLAIRMQGNEIAEVRGVASNQNIDSDILKSNVLEDKLNEFGIQGQRYKKKNADMKRLTSIESLVLSNEELSKDDLGFLYEIDSPIIGFGYQKDPRIKEIQEKRNIKKDLSYLLDISESDIAFNKSEIKEGKTKVYYGNLEWEKENANELSSLERIFGNADFKNLEDARGLSVLKNIGGTADFFYLKSAEGLSNLKSIGGNAHFVFLTNATGLSALENIGGWADFSKLTDATGLNALKNIGGYAYFRSLTDATGLSALENIGGNAYFYNLTNAKGLSALQNIGGNAKFVCLTNAKGLSALQNIGGNADFKNLEDARGLSALQNIGGDAYFNYLTDATGLNALENIGGMAYFRSLTNATGLSALKNIGGMAYFTSLNERDRKELLKRIWEGGL
ncbi:MAG: hypothetical protein ACP5OG_04065 [Candidatus Nanoarchaeia archaeon]